MRVKKRIKRRAVYIYMAIAAVVVFFIVRPMFGSKEEPVIRTAKVERGSVTASVSANGILQPLTTIEVKSNVGGQVVKLAVDEGDEVKPGQLLARIDPTDTMTAHEQNQAELAASLSKVEQAREQLAMQNSQNAAQIRSARESLAASKAKLIEAQEQARIQPKLTNASISQAKSSLAAAEASLRQLKTALIPQRISSAQSAYDQAKAGYDTAQKDLERQKELLKRGFVAKSQVEVSEEKFNVAKAQLDSARRKLDTIKDETDQDLSAEQAKVEQARAALDNASANSVQNKIKQQELASARAAVKQAEASLQSAMAATRENSIRQGDIVQANAQVQRSQAALKNSKTQLSYTTIVAPRAGVVTKKYVEEGSIVTAGRSSIGGSGAGVAILDIADVSRMFALVSVDETDIAQIEAGQEVDVTVEAYPDELFSGKVTKIAPQSVTDQNVTTIPVTVEIDIPDKRLKPGMNVTCDFITGKAEDVLTAPSEAVNESDDGSTVTVIAGGQQVKRNVETGLAGADTTEIVSGLKEGDTVVTSIIQPTTPGRSGGGMSGQGRSGSPGGPGGMGGMGGGGRGMRRGF